MRISYWSSDVCSSYLHHHGVEVGGAGEPRQQRRVLDRVPAPEAAPAEHLVAPPRAEDDADGKEAPGDERGPAGLDEPALTQPAGGEGGDGDGERHGEANVAEVETRGVERPEPGLQQGRGLARAGVDAGTVEAGQGGGGGEA